MNATRESEIVEALRQRILILDGAMGTMVQRYRLDEAAFRGERFRDWAGKDLKGNNELLLLTRPEVIAEIHRKYYEAGSDLVETNTFGATCIGQHDFLFREHPAGRKDPAFFDRVINDPFLCEVTRDMNLAAARLARTEAERAQKADGRPRYVAGAIGPMPVTASLSPDVNDPGFRSVRFDQLRADYRAQVDALLEGGVDVLLVETIFDTLNAKAALAAIEDAFEAAGARVPVMISGTITDRSGRTLTGQTVEAFWNSVCHVNPLSIGLNCALGPREMRPFVEELVRIAPTFTCFYPNAGLPDPLSETGFPETPATLAPQLREWAEAGFLNIVGGCCGTTPDHIRAIAEAVRGCPPRRVPVDPGPPAAERQRGLRGAARDQLRQRGRAHQRHRLARLPAPDQGRPLRGGGGHRPPAGGERRPDHRHQHGRGAAGCGRGHDALPAPDHGRAGHLQGAGHDRLLQVRGHRGRPAVRAGQVRRELHQPEGRRGRLPPPGPGGPALSARPWW
jgi:5-methyltetrahydrofolate--homocysteine methyltransferase